LWPRFLFHGHAQLCPTALQSQNVTVRLRFWVSNCCLRWLIWYLTEDQRKKGPLNLLDRSSRQWFTDCDSYANIRGTDEDEFYWCKLNWPETERPTINGGNGFYYVCRPVTCSYTKTFSNFRPSCIGLSRQRWRFCLILWI
jgi:hypothetical protein